MGIISFSLLLSESVGLKATFLLLALDDDANALEECIRFVDTDEIQRDVPYQLCGSNIPEIDRVSKN